jgi:hypothetical protein
MNLDNGLEISFTPRPETKHLATMLLILTDFTAQEDAKRPRITILLNI